MILEQIIEDKKCRLTEQKRKVSFEEIRRQAEAAKREGGLFMRAMRKSGISIIGEFKRASPSLGKIESKIDFAARLEEYQASVDAISCLTEEDHFLGSTDDLKQIRKLSSLAILRKDFMIDEYQFYETKAMLADAVLLIAAVLDDGQLRAFYALAKELGLDALVEVHNEAELSRACRIGADIIGVNNRDLRDFTIRLETTARLAKQMPKDKIFVSESGISTDADVKFLKECGVDAFLIGRAFMEAAHPKELAARWKQL